MQIKTLRYTNKGYSYIKCTKNDCFNWGGAGICDNCGNPIEGDVYLIFILSSAYCSKCFNEWNQRAKGYKSDLELQKKNDKRWYMYHGFKTV